MDLGEKFKRRIFIYSSTFLAFYLFYGVVLLLAFFGILSFKFSLVLNMIAIFDIIFVLGNILIMFYYGAAINAQFIDHKVQLTKVKHALNYIGINVNEITSSAKFSSPLLKLF